MPLGPSQPLPGRLPSFPHTAPRGHGAQPSSPRGPASPGESKGVWRAGASWPLRIACQRLHLLDAQWPQCQSKRGGSCGGAEGRARATERAAPCGMVEASVGPRAEVSHGNRTSQLYLRCKAGSRLSVNGKYSLVATYHEKEAFFLHLFIIYPHLPKSFKATMERRVGSRTSARLGRRLSAGVRDSELTSCELRGPRSLLRVTPLGCALSFPDHTAGNQKL